MKRKSVGSFFFLFSSLLKSCLRHMLRKRGSLIGPIVLLGIYGLFIYLYVVRDVSPSSRAILLPRFFSLFFLIEIACAFFALPPLRQAASLFRRFPVPAKDRKLLFAWIRSLPLLISDLAFSPFFIKWGWGLSFLVLCLATFAAGFAFFLARDLSVPGTRYRSRLAVPFSFNLTRLFCRPWILFFVYPLACLASLPLSQFMKGDATENRLALLLGAEFVFSFLALFGADNLQKARFLLPYPFGFRRWQIHFHALSFLFLLPGRIAALVVMGPSSGLFLWLLRLYACDIAFLPFIFDPPFAIGAVILFPYFLFAMICLSGHAWGFTAIAALCVLALLSSRKDYRDTALTSGGSRERIDRL
jgi:hypothetical protein